MISIELLDGQVIIKYKMYASQNPDLPTGSNTLTKYHVAKLDKSKAGGERCFDNEECKTGTCLSSGVCLSGTYFAVAQRFASQYYFTLFSAYFVNTMFCSIVYIDSGTRDLPLQLSDSSSNSVDRCLTGCASQNKRYFGVQYGFVYNFIKCKL